MSGTIYGIGLGPGDPDLMSVKTHRLLTNAKHVAFFRKAGRKGQARSIVDGMIPEDAVEFAMEYPVTTEIPLTDPRYNEILSGFYEEVTSHLIDLAKSGEDVVVLCEGDPFFYGSFMHIYTRVKDHVPTEVVPAITGMSGAWTATGAPITWGDDVLTVLMGTLDEDKLVSHIAATDALVIMKIGTNFEKVIRALKAGGKFDDAYLVQFATMAKQTCMKLSEVTEKVTPYFSIIVVHGQGRRP
ncbi:precorrin-2 C(20)-methyltransferase [Cognatishimia activa]|uniref:Precorrin-2 C(20)-methyltransferase n=1 Tax=Cognatishimia activa TaxID=1715691 RepID=A0A0N7MBK6_9RHOB|nr:precorrin-2 C(20)-methyltransferase [Cognatishimia activa]CUI89550.1 Precorrin-2 C(20)-methyltransferase [Cognatishimia activa]CUK25672.1 Precorrin-2 C(20)-methyltransferase [Cognatishimia activa]